MDRVPAREQVFHRWQAHRAQRVAIRAWRMALAKELLRRRELALTEVAERVGYGSTSTFSTAFRRYVGQPPGRYARAA